MTPFPSSLPHVFDPVESCWLAFVPLPVFAARFSPQFTRPTESETEIITWLDANRAKQSEPDDTPEPTAQEEYESAWDEPGPSSRSDVRHRVWSRWIDKLARVKRAEGLVAVRLLVPAEEPPRTLQTATLRHLMEHEAEIDAVIHQAILRSCAEYGGSEDQEVARFLSIAIHPDGMDDLAPVQVAIECEWEVEHGMNVVYHPRIGADWATADGVDDLVADAGPPPLPAPPLTAEEELLEAVFQGNDAKIAELRARGVRPEPEYGSALFGPIHSREVETVRSLLELGADPNRRDSREGTPLEAARRALAEGTLRMPARAPWWMKLLTAMLRATHARHIRRERRNGEAVIRLLKEAGAR